MPAQIEKSELLEAIRNDGPRKVVQQYRHNLLPSRVLIDLYSEHPEHDVLLFLALYPTVPSQVLEDLAEACTNPEIQAAAATNPRCTHLLLVRMAREGGSPVRAALAANKLLNARITAELLTDSDPLVRAALAGNSAIGTPYRTALTLDAEPMVRAALATTAKLPPELILTLSADESAVVRTNVYAFSKAPPELLLGWAQSDDTMAQRLLLHRKNLPDQIIQSLSLSPDPDVQNALHGRYEPTPQQWLAKAESESDHQRKAAAADERLPAEIQHVLARDPVAEVRAALASNPQINEDVALCIAASNDPIACQALAQNPHLPDAGKIELCHHESAEVRLHMAYRDDLTPSLLDILVNQQQDLNLIGHLALRGIRFAKIAPELLPRLLAHKRPSLRTFATAAEQLTHAQVRKLMRDEAVPVRLALCENPILTRMALEELSNDWNPTVATAAQQQLENRPPETEDPSNPPESESGLVSRIVKFFTE